MSIAEKLKKLQVPLTPEQENALFEYWKKQLDDTQRRGYQSGYAAGYQDAQAGAKPGCELREMPLEILILPRKIENCLREHGCRRVGDLLDMDRYDIYGIMGVGAKSASQIAWALQENGIVGTAWDEFALGL